MEFKWSLLCLVVLLLNLVVAEIQEDTADTDSTEEAEESTTVSSLQVPYQMPQPIGEVFFSETFDDGTMDGWVLSRAMKEDTDEEIGKYDGNWEIEELKKNQIPGDKGLVLKSAARHHAIAAMLSKPFIFDDQPLIVQYEVNFQDGIDCGGAYIKLLSHTENVDLEQFFDKTSYTIMFGPDKCGEDYKLHFIFRHKNPKTGDFEEKHAKHTETSLKAYFTDKKTHLYTLVLNLDDTFEIFVDQTSVSKGHLLEDMTPPVNPPEEIEDPDDMKPEEWDERLRIPDPSAAKPDDWNEDEPETIEDADAVKPEGWLDDEPEYIPDPTAEKPLDWDEEVDAEWEAALVPNPKCESAPGCGEWTRPVIPNPNYKGIWIPPMIENPNYQGIWSPRKILNPYYFVDLHPFMMTSFSAIGLELWSMTPDIYFDNFIICSEKEVADQWAADTWGLKRLVASANELSTKHDVLRTGTMATIQSYLYEPEYSEEEMAEREKSQNDGESDESRDDQSLEADPSRLEDVSTLCSCHRCEVMPTLVDNCCCRGNSGCLAYIAKEDTPPLCVTQLHDSKAACLTRSVLQMIMVLMHELRSTVRPHNPTNEWYRLVVYRAFTWWMIHGRLGFLVRRVIRACGDQGIHEKFPSVSGQYKGFIQTVPHPQQYKL